MNGADLSDSSRPGEANGHRLAVDVGGTFIDYVLLNEQTGEILIDKEPSFRDDMSNQVFVGYDRVVRDVPALARMIHGSTLAINTILQETGSRVGLITTRGFRDVLEIGRGNRKNIYDFFYSPAPPLVPRRLRREVSERLDYTGAEVVPLNMDELEAAAMFLVDAGVEAFAISFLHAYANPQHERLAREWLQRRFPNLPVTCSSDVSTEWREFERTSSAVLNAYIMPTLDRYFREIEDGLRSRDFDGDLAVVQSNGGVMPTSVARQIPIRTLASGPSGGVVGARALAQVLGEPNIICADVGGTSFDVALIHDLTVIERFRTEVNGRPILAPTVDVISIGAGGGSIAWIDDRGSLRVGPESAGARPGPACFGFGGDRPTVTDCNLLLGRLDPQNFLGHRMEVSIPAAERAVSRLADELGMDLLTTAGGVIRLAETNMVYAIRQVTIERGHDPRSFRLLAYGGGGGLFAAALIRELEVPAAIVPAASGVFSAWGLLFADYREDAALTRVFTVAEETSDEFAALVQQVVNEAVSKLGAHGIDWSAATCTAIADVRFEGQEFTITVPIRLDLNLEQRLSRLREEFAERHRAQYGQADVSRALEIVTLRATAIGKLAHPQIQPAPSTNDTRVATISRLVWFTSQNRFVDATVHPRADLAVGAEIRGPAVIEEWNATTLIDVDQWGHLDRFGNIVIEAVRTTERSNGA